MLDSATVEYPGNPQTLGEAGSCGINVREVQHAGYKVVGDKTLPILTVHIVDKGKPFAVPVRRKSLSIVRMIPCLQQSLQAIRPWPGSRRGPFVAALVALSARVLSYEFVRSAIDD